jgi:hypothetical protein
MKPTRTWPETIVFAVLFCLVADWAGIYITIRGDRRLLTLLDITVMALFGCFVLFRNDGAQGWIKSGLKFCLLGGLTWSIVRSLAFNHEGLTPSLLILGVLWALSVGAAWCVAAGCLQLIRKHREA